MEKNHQNQSFRFCVFPFIADVSSHFWYIRNN